MKKAFISFVLIVLGLVFLLPAHKALAATFTPNDVIDDGIFDNASSMNAGQINAFLNSFPGSCISPNSGFQAIDPIGYSPGNGFSYGGFTSAGQVLYDAAQAYGINPQVLLVTLQKEQSLVTGGGSICNDSGQNQYAAAVGYACPDSGTSHSYTGVNLYQRNNTMVTTTSSTCVSTAVAAGFSQQVIRGAWLLKFGEQRSEGNIGWAVIKGGWNNSDDPQSCYNGPMTQGTFQRCPSGATTFYDGYQTIDGTSVHMDNGATAALYWYTPHFSGNQHFFSLFSSWFGSTTYFQPIDSMFVTSKQTGGVYFISLDNNTSYYIPTWSTAQAYGLDHYQVMPVDQSTIDGFTNGGTLKTLVWNNDEQKIYLVDHGVRYWFNTNCDGWGLDCLNNTPGDVTFMTSKYLDNIVGYAGTSQPLQYSNGNATYYYMQTGHRDAFATPTDMAATGLGPNTTLQIDQTDLNGSQPLGALQINQPTFIQFGSSTDLQFFDGTHFHHVPTYGMYQAWGNQPIVHPPASTYNINPPNSSSDLTAWATDGSGHYYLVDRGIKIDISPGPSGWYSGTFQTVGSGWLNWLPSVPPSANLSINGGIFVVNGAKLRHVPSYSDYAGLGITPGNTITLSSNALSDFPIGNDMLRNAAFFTVTGNSGLYFVNGNTSFHVPSAAMASDYGIDWSAIDQNLAPAVLSTAYPYSSELTRWVNLNGGLSYITDHINVTISPAMANTWGIVQNSLSTSSMNPILAGVPNSTPLGQFVRDKTTGGIYYASGGTAHYVSSYNTFINLGGSPSSLINVSSDFIAAINLGSQFN